MKEKYFLNGESLPTIPVPHDCVIEKIQLKDQCIEFIFEDDISYHDSIQHYKPDAESLIVRYHFAYDIGVFPFIKPMRLLSKLFSIDGYYKRIKNSLPLTMVKKDPQIFIMCLRLR